MKLFEANKEDILSNAGLYIEMIRIMKTVDGFAPAGSCCGKNKAQHVEQFLKNKEKYMKRSEEIKKRTIIPKWKGVIYVAKLKCHFDANTMTDSQSRLLISQNVLTPVEKYFDLPKTEIAPAVEEKQPIVEEEKSKIVDVTIKETNEPIDEEARIVEVTFEEVNEPIDEELKETKKKTTKRKTKKTK